MEKVMIIILLTSNFILIHSCINDYLVQKLPRIILLIIVLLICILIYLHNLKLKRQKKNYKKEAQLMYEKSICDEMTGLYNHAYIINCLKNITGKYSLMMLDIDNFKEINDTYGHQIGDEVIKYVAKQLKENTRKIDLVGRYGGDEFLIVFVGCNEFEEIKAVVNKIKRKIEISVKDCFYH